MGENGSFFTWSLNTESTSAGGDDTQILKAEVANSTRGPEISVKEHEAKLESKDTAVTLEDRFASLEAAMKQQKVINEHQKVINEQQKAFNLEVVAYMRSSENDLRLLQTQRTL